MPKRYVDTIIKYLSDRSYRPAKLRQLARQMGIADDDYGTFRDAVKLLQDEGRIVLGAHNAVTLPQIGTRMTGFFRASARGFGFVIPETPNAHGDLYIPEGSSGGAMTGDLVEARVFQQGRREGKTMYAGEVIKIITRGRNRFVGTLQQADATWFVLPDGKQMTQPIVVRDISSASPQGGTKVVVEITEYPTRGELPVGVIVEVLGEKGELDVETTAIIRAHGLADEWSPAALDDARAAIAAFDLQSPDSREDLTATTIVTIDPPDARDYDDAISIEAGPGGSIVLGVHIADVSYFVREGTTLDEESRQRATSTYFPKRVVPMLPEILSNGVCSLQQGQSRYCKSAFIGYDENAKVTSTRFAETVIRSARRLTYQEAQDIIDGKTGGFEQPVVDLVQRMEPLARRIEARRRREGMLHLDLPEVALVFDANNKVVDAVPEDNAYTHTIIEMFMVEANEAVAALMDRLGRPCLRRIHPDPDQAGSKQLAAFLKACGYTLPMPMSRRDMQDLLASVRGKPESYAVNLALLKTFEQAEYSPMVVGHFALASEHYCHFTSPIRRYPDLTVHRLLSEHVRGTMSSRPPEDVSALIRLGEHCTTAERRSEAAEDELREVLILEFLATKIGEDFDGVITGVTSFGVFVQSMQFLIEGLVRLEDLGDDWWEVDPKAGMVTGERTGKRYRLGDMLQVRIANVDQAKRQLNLAPVSGKKPKKAAKGAKAGKAEKATRPGKSPHAPKAARGRKPRSATPRKKRRR